MRYHFFFPASRIGVVAPPKTGSTSLLQALIELENRLSGAVYSLPGQTAHKVAAENFSWVTGCQPERSIAVLRDPVERFYSAFLDKLLLSRDQHYVAAPEVREIQKLLLNTKKDAKHNMQEMLRSLQSGNFSWDGHFVPQTSILSPNASYSEVIDFTSIGDIVKSLEIFHEIPPGQLGKLESNKNPNSWELKNYLLDAKTINTIRNIFKDDYAYASAVNLTFKSKVPKSGNDESAIELIRRGNVRRIDQLLDIAPTDFPEMTYFLRFLANKLSKNQKFTKRDEKTLALLLDIQSVSAAERTSRVRRYVLKLKKF